MPRETVTISQLAASAEVHVETVRYYQRRGLLAEPPRPAGGIRRYGQADMNRLQFIRRAQLMGFSLDEISGLLELKGRHACERTRQLTEVKLSDVRGRLAELQQLESDLVALVAECAHVRSDGCCPTLELFEQEGGSPGRGATTSLRHHPASTKTSSAGYWAKSKKSTDPH